MRLPPVIEMTARRAVGSILGPAVRRAHVQTFPAQRAALLDRLGVAVVLDVGANIGQYGAQLRLYGHGGAIHSFEPLADAYRQLAARAAGDRNWQVRQVGLGRAAGTATLHVAGNSQSSSLLPMLPRHLESAPESAVIGEELVEIVTLEQVLAELAQECFLKIDAQGSERAILEGGGELEGVAGLELELSLVPLYQGETLFADMVSWLAAKRFELCGIGSGLVDQRGALLQVDALFARF